MYGCSFNGNIFYLTLWLLQRIFHNNSEKQFTVSLSMLVLMQTMEQRE